MDNGVVLRSPPWGLEVAGADSAPHAAAELQGSPGGSAELVAAATGAGPSAGASSRLARSDASGKGSAERLMRGLEAAEARLADAGTAAPRRAGSAAGERWAVALMLWDAVATSLLGLLVEPAGTGTGAIAAVLSSGPLLALALAATGGYRLSVLGSRVQAALALVSLLAAVVLPIALVRMIDEPAAYGPRQAALWLVGAFACQFALRLAFRRLVGSTAGASRPGLLVLAEGEIASPSLLSANGVTPALVPFRLTAEPAAIQALAERIAREQPSELVVSSHLLDRLAAHAELRARLLDRILAAPGRVRIMLPGGTREPVLLATLLEPALGPGARLAKRALDLVVASLLLVVSAPLLLLCALLIKLDSPGPVFFRQPRIGYGGRLFRVWKFRTMYHEATDTGGRHLTVRNDPRVTRIGGFLRRSSLDELPQLLNVLAGDMSLVGPRPHALEPLAGGRPYAEVVPDIARRLRVKPGITGLAQVEGWRGTTDTERKLIERVRADLRYIEGWSFWLDLEILLRTPFASLMSKDAY